MEKADRRTPTARGENDERIRAEFAVMLSDLNEVRMRLDTVVRRLGPEAVDPEHPGSDASSVERLRARLFSQLDRIREKLLTRMPNDS